MGIVEIIIAALGLATTIAGFAAGRYSGKKAALKVVDERTVQAPVKPASKIRATPKARRGGTSESK